MAVFEAILVWFIICSLGLSVITCLYLKAGIMTGSLKLASRKVSNEYLVAAVFGPIFTLMLLTTVIWLPLNYALLHNGRNGFLYKLNGKYKLDFSPESFRKVWHTGLDMTESI